jgi:hypothetical protein
MLQVSYLLFISVAVVEPSPLLLGPLTGLSYQPWTIYGDDYGAISGMTEWQGKPKYPENTRHSATCLDSASPGSRGGKPAANRLTYCKAKFCR